MEYFRISQIEYIPNIVKLLLRSKFPKPRRIAFEKKDKLVQIATVFVKANYNSTYPDIFDVPTFIVSDRLRKLLEIYDNDIVFKCAVLTDPITHDQHVYFVVILDAVDCKHESTEFIPNGSLKKLVIDKNKAAGNKVFRVKGVKEPYVYVSLDVAESMLRRGFLGIHFEKVESL